MKSCKALLAVAVMLVAQTVSAKVEVGVGVSARSSDAWIYIPINVSDSFRVEPAFREFSTDGENRYGVTKSGNTELSVGFFVRSQIKDNVGMYYGARVGYIKGDSEYESEYGDNKSEYDGHRIAPALGFEYYATKRFSIGVEAGWYYMDIDGEDRDINIEGRYVYSDEVFNYKNNSKGTDTRLLIRFMF